MITSDATVDRYYYIFDSRAHRALVMDRRTGEEVDWRDAPRIQLIDYVAEARSGATRRRFARWCARQTGVHTAPADGATGRLWTAAESGNAKVWRRAREAATDAVVEAAALNLPRRQASAAQLLTVHACTHPSAEQAAVDAAHMSERWAEFAAEADPETAARRMRQRQVDWFLDALSSAY
jgi:hypothetical protein